MRERGGGGERERQRDRETERQRDRQREGERGYIEKVRGVKSRERVRGRETGKDRKKSIEVASGEYAEVSELWYNIKTAYEGAVRTFSAAIVRFGRLKSGAPEAPGSTCNWTLVTFIVVDVNGTV